jgi:DNA-binding NtrC family response regulator
LCTKHPGKDVTTDQLVSELDWEDTDAAPPSPRTDSAASTDAARQRLQTGKNFQLDQLLKELERSYVEAALELSSGNLSKAARMLGIHRTTLYSRMQSYEQPTREDS